MTDALLLVMALGAGLLVGLGFFWGLWCTLNGLERSRRPALRVLLSLLFRTGVLAVALYACMRYLGWQATLAAVAGLALARLLLVQTVLPRASEAEIDS